MNCAYLVARIIEKRAPGGPGRPQAQLSSQNSTKLKELVRELRLNRLRVCGRRRSYGRPPLCLLKRRCCMANTTQRVKHSNNVRTQTTIARGVTTRLCGCAQPQLSHNRSAHHSPTRHTHLSNLCRRSSTTAESSRRRRRLWQGDTPLKKSSAKVCS